MGFRASTNVESMPELADLVAEVRRTGQAHVLRQGAEPVALLTPLPAGPKRTRGTKAAMAIVERTAGVFKQYAKHPPPTPAEEKAAFEQAVADEVMGLRRDSGLYLHSADEILTLVDR